MEQVPLILALCMGVFYMTTMKKMAVFKPLKSQQSKYVILKMLGIICLLGAIGLWGLYFSSSRKSYADVLITIDFSCIVLGWAVYCFYFKKSNTGAGKKALKILYAVVLTIAYLGSYTNLLFMVIYAIIASCVYGTYIFTKRKNNNEEVKLSDIDIKTLENTVIKERSPYGETWQKEMENKSYDELIQILSTPEHYNAEFIKMTWDRLKTFDNFNETEVEAQINKLREQTSIPKVKNNRCPYCGKKIKDNNAEFCKYCGKPLIYK